MNRKIFGFSRKSGEGFVIETPVGHIKITVHKRNGRIGVVFDIPEEAYNKSLGVYRIDSVGVKQNKPSTKNVGTTQEN